MRSARLRKVIAKRTLSLEPSGDRSPSTAVVAFAKPVRVPNSTDYVCYYQIEGLSCAGIRKAMGVDSIQALFLALTSAASILYTSEEHKAGWLTYLDESNLGLPAYEKYFSECVAAPRELFFA